MSGTHLRLKPIVPDKRAGERTFPSLHSGPTSGEDSGDEVYGNTRSKSRVDKIALGNILCDCCVGRTAKRSESSTGGVMHGASCIANTGAQVSASDKFVEVAVCKTHADEYLARCEECGCGRSNCSGRGTPLIMGNGNHEM